MNINTVNQIRPAFGVKVDIDDKAKEVSNKLPEARKSEFDRFIDVQKGSPFGYELSVSGDTDKDEIIIRAHKDDNTGESRVSVDDLMQKNVHPHVYRLLSNKCTEAVEKAYKGIEKLVPDWFPFKLMLP